MNRIINRLFGASITSVSLKDVLDKFEAYLGIMFLLMAAAIEWSLIQFAARTGAPGAFAWMVPVNVAVKSILGYNGLVWVVKGAWLLANLWLFARRGKSSGIVPMALATAITYEYGACTRFPWVAFIIALVLTVVVWFISLKMTKPSTVPVADATAEAERQKALRRWNWIRRVAILLTIILILILVGQITSFGVKLVILVPLVLRILDLILKHN